MLQAMLSSMSSIEAQQSRMDVIGNNLANVNTDGYKSSDASFEDLVSQVVTEGVNTLQYGTGVAVGSTPNDMTQGTLNATGQPSDLALEGSGYFTVANGSGMAYTRDGEFTLDANGQLVTQTGQPVLGWSAGSNGTVDNTGAISATSTINVPMGTLSAFQGTSKVAFGGNLDSATASSATVTSSVNVFDSLGGAQDVTITYGNPTSPPAAGAPAGATSSWSWTATLNGNTIGSSASAGSQPLYFNSSGQIINGTSVGNISLPASGGAAASTISLDFSGISQNASASGVQSTGQDGSPPGSLQSFTVGQDGTVTGIFSNGMTKTLAQIAVANFANPGGLANLGNNLQSASVGSGPASIGVAGQGGRGTIQAGYLEASNVDIGTQFTNLIVTQRGYEANTRVVTAVDQMLQDLLQMVQ